MFDFYQIVGPENSKQENFSALCSHLIMKIFPAARHIEGKGGDEGVDTIIGEFNGPCHVFQHKYFIDRIGPSQRKQIENSLKTALKHHDVTKWTLMIPTALNPAELKWFQSLEPRYSPVPIECWDRARLQELLSRYPEIAQSYQPFPVIKIVLLDKELNLQELPSEKLAEIFRKVSGIAPQQNAAENSLMAAAADMQKRSKLKVLIWGPGPSDEVLYKKRCEIREQLIRLGHQADFSETVWTPQKLEASGLNLTVAEYLQSKSYDYIICIMASPGSIGEVHDFAKDKYIACKMMICLDESHKSGYSAHGTLRIFEGQNGKIDWFENPIDIKKCYLSGRVLQHIQKVNEAKQWEVAKGNSL